MRSLLLGSLLLPLLAGCTDYLLRTGPDGPDERPDTSDDTDAWGEDCPTDDKVYDGYEVPSLTPGCKEGAPLADLTLTPAGRCEVDCEDDRVVFWVHPGNKGQADVTGARLHVYVLKDGERELVDVLELDGMDLPAGWYADSVAIDLAGYDAEDLGAFIVRIEGNTTDCDPSNDELNVLGPFCD